MCGHSDANAFVRHVLCMLFSIPYTSQILYSHLHKRVYYLFAKHEHENSVKMVPDAFKCYIIILETYNILVIAVL